MKRKIILSKLSSKKLSSLLEYLEQEWSLKVKNNFIKKLENSLELIKDFPASAEKSLIKKNVHKLNITKQTAIYYIYDSKSIKILTIFDNRMDTKNLEKELKNDPF